MKIKTTMYIVIERFPDPYSATIVTDPDTGENLVFDDIEDANNEAGECQDGIVVEI